jgi:UDP-N-acetylglucosamine--N-acetylmuramyl-(pentapeptide) pyrophosphoryl-undecaprenol N-acetylglucosamine transferase
MTTIVLSAGGTGGHLFPAQALAAELTRRGRKIVVMTDARGTQYPTYFPARDRDRAGRRLLRPFEIAPDDAPFEIMAGIVGGVPQAVARQTGGRGRLRRLSEPAGDVAACLARFPPIVAQDAVLGRANRLVANYVRAIAGGLPLKRFLPKDMSKVVYTGNPVRPEVVAFNGAPYDSRRPAGRCVCSCSAAARARAR